MAFISANQKFQTNFKVRKSKRKQADPISEAILKKDILALKEHLKNNSQPLDFMKITFCNDSFRDELKFPQFLDDQAFFHKETSLEIAARTGFVEGVRLLLSYGASARHTPRRSVIDPPCALLWACYKGHANVVEVLLQYGADIHCLHKDSPCKYGSTSPLSIAIKYKRLNIVKLLVTKGARLTEKVRQKFGSLENEFCLALELGNLEIIQFLIGAGIDVETGYLETIITHLYAHSKGPRAENERNQILQLFAKAGAKHDTDLWEVVDQIEEQNPSLQFDYNQKTLTEYMKPKALSLGLKEKSRITIRRELIRNSNSRSILPSLGDLPLTEDLKNYLSFDILCSTLPLAELCKKQIRNLVIMANESEACLAEAATHLPLPKVLINFITF